MSESTCRLVITFQLLFHVRLSPFQNHSIVDQGDQDLQLGDGRAGWIGVFGCSEMGDLMTLTTTASFVESHSSGERDRHFLAVVFDQDGEVLPKVE